jgi:C4-dicarboxylate-specific signal transduction histidine kinase
VSPDRRSEAERLLAAAVATGQAQSGEIPGIGADGALALYSFCVAPMREGDEIVGLISVATDITEMKRAQENARELQMELAHVARLSTMGEMASGMAHELNQPLAAIIAYADACQELVESGRIDQNQLRDVLQAVASQADRAGKIIQRLRNLVKKSRPVRAAIQVNEAVREVAALVEAETREAGVRLKLNLEERLPAASADFVQIQQVLLNLMRNGLDAMVGADAGRRELDVSTRRNSDGQLEVAICDCGRGVACDDISRLFEPFFTTKAEGLGMGLPISRTIVEAHGGRLWLTPNPDVGMTAKFVLPGIDGRVPHVNETNGLHRR